MTVLNKQELEIIQVFSSVSVPEKIIRDSNIKELIQGMTAEQEAVHADARRLERLRQEKKEGNFIGNWWHDRDDKVQDAQIDLNKTIGRLTQKSSQLLIVNTAISKVLNDQQRVLLEQQNTLKQQTDTLEEQNRKILEQQKLLEKQQQDINKANQGLMEAKGITQEQAHKLVGCVVRVTEAEKKIDVANEALRVALEQHMNDSIAQCIASLKNGFAEQEQRNDAFEKQLISAFSEQSLRTQAELQRFAAESTQLQAKLEHQLEATVDDLGRHRDEFERQLTSTFSIQSQHVQAELARSASDTTEFKANIGQQLQAHIQSVIEKTSAQDVAAQQLRETFSTQMKKIQQDMVSTVEKEHLAILESVKATELKHAAALQEQNLVLSAQREALRSTDNQLALLRVERQRDLIRNRLALAGMVCLILASIGWQLAQHYVLS